MRRGPRVILIIATIVSAAIAAWLPAVPAHAVQGTVKVTRGATVSTCSFGPATIVELDMVCGTVGNVQITDKAGTTGARVEAVAGASQNQLSIKNLVIKNLGTSATVEIDANHNFSTTNTNVARSYGIGNNASFSRKNASNITILASGNKLEKKGFYTYFDGASQFTDQIGGGVGTGTTLSYTVPASGSTTANTVPIPSQTASEPNRTCANLATAPPCTAGETLRTVLTVTLTNVNDLVTIPGGDETVAGDNGDGFVNAVLGSLSIVLRLQQNTPNARINPFDTGYLTVEMLCNPDFPCANVNQASLAFGPLGALPKSVKIKDVNMDGNADLQIKVAQQETGIVCGDTAATLSGTATFPIIGDFPFDAIVGFFTDPGVCPSP